MKCTYCESEWTVEAGEVVSAQYPFCGEPLPSQSITLPQEGTIEIEGRIISTDVTELNFDGMYYRLHDLNPLTQLSQLTELNLSHHDNLTDLSLLASLSQLKTLLRSSRPESTGPTLPAH